MQQVSAHERRLPAEVSILGQNQLEVQTKGAIMSSAWCLSPRVNIITPRPLGVTTAFFGLRRHHVFFRQRAQELQLHILLTQKNVKPCVVIYVYSIFNFFVSNSARVKHARHKVIAATYRLIVKRSLQNSRIEKMETSECAQIKPHQNSFPYQINEPQNTTYDSAEFRAKYNRALSNLALSMQKSEMSRTQIIYQRQNQAHGCNNVNRISTSSLPELSLVY